MPSSVCGADATTLAIAARREGWVTVIGMDPEWATNGIPEAGSIADQLGFELDARGTLVRDAS